MAWKNCYVYENGFIQLSLTVPDKMNPWAVTLTVNNQIISKEVFCLRNPNISNRNIPESVNDLPQAKEKAFQIMDNYLKGCVDRLTDMRNTLTVMKDQPDT